jgi:hypothetical protein
MLSDPYFGLTYQIYSTLLERVTGFNPFLWLEWIEACVRAGTDCRNRRSKQP